MDFHDSPADAAFRKTVQDWLAANAADYKRASSTKPRDALTISDETLLARARSWQKKKAAAGYAAVTWPKDYGGLGGTPIQSVIYAQEEAKYSVPRGFFEIGLGMCIPTLMSWATPEQLQRYVKPALYGEEIWCQLFSEPAAGSDLAGLRMRAERSANGKSWTVNGQKVWTSGAQFSDYGILVTRSDPSVPKHKGLTYFFVDMKSPGIEVRPIRQMSGDAGFNEVFFKDVEIPDAQRLGEVGQGWKVALTTLMNERLAIGQGEGVDVDALMELARAIEWESGTAIQNPAVRERLADWYVQTQGLKYTKFRTLTALAKGETPGPGSAIGKIVSGPKMQDIGAFGMELQGQSGIVRGKDRARAQAFSAQWVWGAGYRIAGGTDEILRNIIAEQVLGLPQDIRVDKNVPFNELPQGK